jgi:hypothetical protein
MPVMIDPANPYSNLLDGMKSENIAYLKKEATKAISNLEKEDYQAVFDPENKTKHFSQ